MSDNEGKIATIEANTKNFGDALNRVENLLGESYRQRNAQHSETIQRLAIIETKQDVFSDYQKSCDEDRDEIKKKIADIENYQSRQTGIAMAVSAVISGALATASWFIGKH